MTPRSRAWSAAGVVALLVLLAAAIFGPEKLGAEELPEGARFGLFVLWYIDLTLTAALVFVLLRSLIKLIFERRSRTPGSRFRVRLVATHLGLALLPTALVFVIASDLLQRSLDRWFSPAFESALADTRALAETLVDRELARAGVAAQDLAQRLRGGELDFETVREERKLDRLEIWEGDRRVAGVGGGEWSVPLDMLAEAVTEGRSSRIVADEQSRFLMAAAVVPPRSAAGATRLRVVVAGIHLAGDLDRAARGAVEAHQAYLRREQERPAVKAFSMLLFLTLTLLVLFAAVWIGLYVGRRLTTPIQALVESTRKVAAGDLSARVQVDADEELQGLVASYNAMVERLAENTELVKRSNAELAEANRTLDTGRRFVRAILESATTAILAVGDDGTIRIANRSAAALLGGERARDLVGRRLQEFTATTAGAALVDLITALAADRGAQPVREFHVEAGGETRTFEARVAPLRASDGGGGPLEGGSDDLSGSVIAVEDVTGVVAAQRAAAWQEVARRMAHEVKNPLTPIRLSAERIRRRLEDGDTSGLRTAISEGTDTIVEAVGSLSSLVEEFSRFARLPRFETRPTDVGSLVRRTAALYAEVRPAVKVTVEIVDLDGERQVDPDGLRRALINLIENALEAAPEGGTVTVTATGLSDRIRISVADSGAGIPAEDRGRIFQPYFSTKGRGSGLGLPIVRRIVLDHGGTIRVEENEPRGARFVVELPG